MSFFNSTVAGYEGISVEYKPAHEGTHAPLPAWVHISLDGSDAYLCLSIEDARSLADQMPVVMALHEAAVASANKAA
ncbi:hypothetical protein ACIA5H_02830 [Nocardia sp. NPDC051900]|uniref:hypothetical protein n=1 Tax=Nocardia sp. NPDC051900 TaxID=3364326 RepID=UPI0037936F17